MVILIKREANKVTNQRTNQENLYRSPDLTKGTEGFSPEELWLAPSPPGTAVRVSTSWGVWVLQMPCALPLPSVLAGRTLEQTPLSQLWALQ